MEPLRRPTTRHQTAEMDNGIMARLKGESSNRVIEILLDWNEHLKASGIERPEPSL